MKKQIILFLLIGFSLSLFAQWNTNNTFMNLSTSGEMPILKVKSAVTPSGETWLAYSTYTSGYMVDCKIQLLDVNGEIIFDEDGLSLISNSRDLPSSADSFGLTCDDDGNAIICFPSACGLPSYMPLPRVFKIDTAGNQLWGNDGIALPVSSDMIDSCDIYKFNGEIFATWSNTDYSTMSSSTYIINLASTGDLKWVNPISVPGKNACLAPANDGFIAFWVDNRQAKYQIYNLNGDSTEDIQILSEEGFSVNEPWSGPAFIINSVDNNFAIAFTGYTSQGENAICFAKWQNDNIKFSEKTSDYSFENINLFLDNSTDDISIIWSSYDYSLGSKINMLSQSGNEIFDTILLENENTLSPLYAKYTPENQIFCVWAEAEGWSGSNLKTACFNSQGIKTAELDLFFTSSDFNAGSFESTDTDAFLYMPYTNDLTYETQLIGMRIPLSCSFETTGVEKNNFNNVTNEDKSFYSIDGRKIDVNSLKKGIYIEHSSQGSRKIYVSGK